jgi:hypothetical protein
MEESLAAVGAIMRLASTVALVAMLALTTRCGRSDDGPGLHPGDVLKATPASAAPPAASAEVDATCPDASWTSVRHAAAFALCVPPSLVKGAGIGIDSVAEDYVGPGVRFGLDFGAYTDPLTSYGEKPEFREEQLAVDGHAARLVTYREPAVPSAENGAPASPDAAALPLHLALYFVDAIGDAHDHLGLFAAAATDADAATVRAIFATTRFAR